MTASPPRRGSDLARWLFGKPNPNRRVRVRRRKDLTEAERHDLLVDRGFRCGELYSRKGWVRRMPPRMRGGPIRGPEAELLTAIGQAFYRGYDAQTRRRYALRTRPASAGAEHARAA